MSHYNVISNVMQYTTYESMPRKKLGIDTQVALGLLPFSHIYGLIIVTHASSYRGDSVVVLPKYDLKSFLAAVERFKIEHLFLVPPIVVQMIRNPNICAQYDLSSARFIYTGAAPLGTETVDSILKMYPKWRVGQGYGGQSLRRFCGPGELITSIRLRDRHDRDVYRRMEHQRAGHRPRLFRVAHAWHASQAHGCNHRWRNYRIWQAGRTVHPVS